MSAIQTLTFLEQKVDSSYINQRRRDSSIKDSTVKKMEEQSTLWHFKQNLPFDEMKYVMVDNIGWDKINKDNLNENNSWICEVCTFNNKSSSYRCIICESENPRNYIPNGFTKFRIGDLYDVKDIINRWLPAKVVHIEENYITFHFRGYKDYFDEILDVSNQKDRSRISLYESHCREYGLNRYTAKYYSKEVIRRIIEERIKKEEDSDDDEKGKYYEGRRIYFATPDNSFTYEFTIVKYNEENNTLDLKYGSEIIDDVPIDLLQLECDYKKEKIMKFNNTSDEDNDERKAITINTCRKALKEDNKNMIINLTNSFISDLNRCTVYSNEDCDLSNLNGIEVYA